jgi:hypothetical protein
VPSARSPVMFHRAAVRYLNSLDIPEIRVLCDERFPRAREWLARLQFTETDESMNDCKIWIRKTNGRI